MMKTKTLEINIINATKLLTYQCRNCNLSHNRLHCWGTHKRERCIYISEHTLSIEKWKMAYCLCLISCEIRVYQVQGITELTCKGIYKYGDPIRHRDEKQKGNHFHLPWSEQTDSYTQINYKTYWWAIFQV